MENEESPLYADIGRATMNLLDALILAAYIEKLAEDDDTEMDAWLTVEARVSVRTMIDAAIDDVNTHYTKLLRNG